MEVPGKIYFDGKVVPWEEATIHVWTETAIRATNVFEGLRAYWIKEKTQWHIVALEEHLDRLFQSTKLLRIPHKYTREEIKKGMYDLLFELTYREHMYVRPTIFIRKGSYGYKEGHVDIGIYIVAFPVPDPEGGLANHKYIVSSWKKANDLILPPRVKTGVNYGNFRLPRIEADSRGFNDAIILNDQGKVAETGGAAIFIVRDNVVYTPPISAGILESITRKILIKLLKNDLNIEVVERDIDRTELYIADEVFACGTLQGVAAVYQIDDYKIDDGKEGKITRLLYDRYMDIMFGRVEDKMNIVTCWTEEK